MFWLLFFSSKLSHSRWKFLSATDLWLAKNVSLKSFRLCPVQTSMLLTLGIDKPVFPILCLSKFRFIRSLWSSRKEEGIVASSIQKGLFCAISAIAAMCFPCSGSSTGTQLYHWRIWVHVCLLTCICSKYFLSCSRWPIPTIFLILHFEILVVSILAVPKRKEMFSLTLRHR